MISIATVSWGEHRGHAANQSGDPDVDAGEGLLIGFTTAADGQPGAVVAMAGANNEKGTLRVVRLSELRYDG